MGRGAGDASTCSNSRNMLSSFSGVMPHPVSDTTISTAMLSGSPRLAGSSKARHSTDILPLLVYLTGDVFVTTLSLGNGRLYSRAFAVRFAMTVRIFFASPTTRRGHFETSISNCNPRRAASLRYTIVDSNTTLQRSKGSLKEVS